MELSHNFNAGSVGVRIVETTVGESFVRSLNESRESEGKPPLTDREARRMRRTMDDSVLASFREFHKLDRTDQIILTIDGQEWEVESSDFMVLLRTTIAEQGIELENSGSMIPEFSMADVERVVASIRPEMFTALAHYNYEIQGSQFVVVERPQVPEAPRVGGGASRFGENPPTTEKASGVKKK